MTNYIVAFLLKGFHDLSPHLKIGKEHVSYITELGDEARQLLEEEVGELLKGLWSPRGLPCIEIDVQAADEKAAIKKAWPPAKRIADALALVEFEEEAISLAVERSPHLLPNVLVANLDDKPPTVKFSSYTPLVLGSFNIGEMVQIARRFNEKVVRHLGALIPSELHHEQIERPVVRRLAHSLHWYSQGMNQPELSFHFIALWFALESLVIEDTQTKKKGRKLVHRLSSLVTKHTNVQPDEQDLWDLWKLRSDIVHEAIGGIMEPDAHQISASHINRLRYLYFLTLLFVLDLQAKATSLTEIWSGLKAYKPSLTISPDEVPLLLHVTDIFREQTSA